MIKSEPVSVEWGRTIKGLSLLVKAHPVVEEFFQIASGGETNPVGLYGRLWGRKGDGELSVYEIPPSMQGTLPLNNRTAYSLDGPGRKLVMLDGVTGLKTVNVAMLRLVGITDGITLQVSGVFSTDEVNFLADSVLQASRVIYDQYIKPMVISTSLVDDLPPREVTRELDLRQPDEIVF